jgi:DNA helicase-2/ATP-dependent DNA helicase PcrA
MSVFSQQYKVLNPAQKQAVDTVEGPVIVIAGPGTGKTTILTLRIANIIRTTDTAPENILSLTFTESGAYVMRKKLVELIGASAYKVNIHTFHGFAERIIQQYPDYFPRIIGSKVITDAEQIKIIENLIEAKDIEILRPYGDPNYYVRPILAEISTLKRENISPKKFLASIKKDLAIQKDEASLGTGGSKGETKLSKTALERIEKRNSKNLELAKIYERYEDELAKQKYYDFNDMLLELIVVMEKEPTFKLILQETYQYILADEHQDANASQNRILELLSDFHDMPNLFIVGDDKQAIYRFQGASLDNFLYFKDKYKDAKIIELTHNYRSQQGILDASHSLISKNPTIPGRDRTRLVSLQIGSKPINVYEFPNRDKELQHLAYLIKEYTKKSSKLEELAILYRTNGEAEIIAKELKKENIRYRIESDHNILDEVDPAKLIIIARAVNDLSNDEYLGKTLLLQEFGCDPGSVSMLFNYSKKEKVPLFRIINELRKPSRNSLFEAIDKQNVETIIHVYTLLSSWAHEAQHQNFPNLLQKIIEESKILPSIMKDADSLPRLSSLEDFFAQITKISQSKKTFLLSDFIEYIDVVLDHGLVSKRGFTEHIDGVRLMTAHRSKGLEFDHVFIVNFFDGNWGNRNKRNLFSIPIIENARDAGNIEDERRLFYVALTRARETVHISYSRVIEEKEAVVSQFLKEIDGEHLIATEPAIFESNLLGKKVVPIAKSNLSILDPGFVKSKFVGQPLSVTHLNNYLECPWQYFFVNLIRIPQVETKHQVYGTAVHNALRAFFEAYKEERDLSKKELLEIFEHKINGSSMNTSDKADSIKKGKKALTGYYDTYKNSWNRTLLTEYGIKVPNFEIDKHTSIVLTGNLDKVEFIDSHNAAVIDFKTAKPKSRNEIEGKTKEADGNYKRQLVFYQLLLDLEGKYKMNSGTIDFIEPNERGLYKKEQFIIEENEVNALKETIRNVSKEVMDLKFVDKYCDNKDCKYCQLAKVIGI